MGRRAGIVGIGRWEAEEIRWLVIQMRMKGLGQWKAGRFVWPPWRGERVVKIDSVLTIGGDPGSITVCAKVTGCFRGRTRASVELKK